MKNYSLIVSVPDAEPTLFELRGDRVGLGRELDNQIRLKVNEVSSSHCEFRKLEGGGYEVVDLGSTNGTRVNGKQIERTQLADGDRLLIGEVVPVHFVELAEGASPVAVAVEAGEGGRQAAAAYTQMDEKLQSIEATIALKAGELAVMQRQHEAKQAEYAKMLASLEALEAQIAAKRAESGGDSEEVRRMEMDLLTQTRRIQVLRTDLDGQAQQLHALQGGAPAPLTPAAAAAAQRATPIPVVPVPMSASPHAPQPVQSVPQPAQAVAPPTALPRAVPLAVVSPSVPPQTPPPHAAAPVGNLPTTPPLASSGPRTTLLTPGVDPAAPPTRRLLVDAPAKPKAKLNFGGNQQGS